MVLTTGKYMENDRKNSPLADRMRPRTLGEYIGQEHIVGKGTLLRQLIEKKELRSIMLWGPPGVGKTTLAQIIAHETGANFVMLSGVMSGKADLQRVVKEADLLKNETGERTLLFIDEIHRWNKAQQDALLPYVESGLVTLIGATTENPSFEIIGALLSRSQVFILHRLSVAEIVTMLERAILDKEHGLGNTPLVVERETLEVLAGMVDGDGRQALNALELAYLSKRKKGAKKLILTKEDIKSSLQKSHLVFDKNGEEFYNVISALHKSMRGSDANASLYWLARMLEGGVDPIYVARRVVRFASEDIGMANSEALVQAIAAFDACDKLGMPECSVHLAQAVVYCAKSKKSNLLYTAYKQAAEDARNTSSLGVPIHLRNAPTKFMKEIGYGKEYKYNPDYDGPVEQEYLPEELKGRNYLDAKK